MKNYLLFTVLCAIFLACSAEETRKDNEETENQEVTYTPQKKVNGKDCYTTNEVILLNTMNITDSIRALQLIPNINNGKADGVEATMDKKDGERYVSTKVKYGTSFYHVENRRVVKVVIHGKVLNLNGVTVDDDFETFGKKFNVSTKFDKAIRLVTERDELLKFYFSDAKSIDSIVYEKINL